MVEKGRPVWMIKSSLNDTGREHLLSGRATNSPASPEAGTSVRKGFTKWRYFDGSNWTEGDISVTCKLDDDEDDDDDDVS